MSPSASLLAASVALLSSLSLAQVRGEVVIQSRDGKAVVGRVITETAKGYLLATATGTQVVEFGDIADIRQLVPAMAAAPVVAGPAPAAPTAWSEVPPLPPARPEDHGPAGEVSTIEPEKSDRTGLHFGLGVNTGFSLPSSFDGSLGGGLDFEAQGALDFNFGRAGYRLNLNLGGSTRPYGAFAVAVDNLLSFALGDVFAFGAGVQVGVLFGGLSMVQVSPLIQPMILRLGERGQHQLALTASYCVLSTVAYDYTGYGVAYAGTGRTMLNYSYLF